jgi:hypothetical protein
MEVSVAHQTLSKVKNKSTIARGAHARSAGGRASACTIATGASGQCKECGGAYASASSGGLYSNNGDPTNRIVYCLSCKSQSLPLVTPNNRYQHASAL